jgi:hypothetical protein
MSTLSTPVIFPDLAIAAQTVYKSCGFVLSRFEPEPESTEYEACTFMLNDLRITSRLANITPAKNGQFVTLWTRNAAGITEPYSIDNGPDLVIITARRQEDMGQFIFPRHVLASKGIFTTNGREGKRGFRIYPPWDIPESKQASGTQQWQSAYFLHIIPGPVDSERANRLLNGV